MEEEGRAAADVDTSVPKDNGTAADEAQHDAAIADTSAATTNGDDADSQNTDAESNDEDDDAAAAEDAEEEAEDANATAEEVSTADDKQTEPDDTAYSVATTATVNEVDLDQCRVCLCKADLVNIFALGEHNMRICDVVMTVCRVKILERDYLPNFLCAECVVKMNAAMTVKTACETMDKELRSKLKRSKKTAVRRARGDFVLVDCASDSSSEDEANGTAADGTPSTEKKARAGKRRDDDDDEFQISDGEAEEASVADSSDSSYTDIKPKVKVTPAKRRGRPPKNAQKTPPAPVVKLPAKRGPKPKHDVVYVNAATANSDDASSDDDDAAPPPPKRRGRPAKNASATPASKASTSSLKTPTSQIPHKKRALRHHDDDDDDDGGGRHAKDSDEDYTVKEKKTPGSSRKGHPCPFCDEVFSTYEKLREHKKKYIGQKPLECSFCGKTFKQRVSYDSHVQRHKENGSTPVANVGNACSVCKQTFHSRIEMRRHEQAVHDLSYPCKKCKRTFTSKGRLDRHQEHTCPGFKSPGGSAPSTSAGGGGSAVKRIKLEPSGSSSAAVAPTGKDLFRCVAPLTTTYWSDSFSD